MSRFELTGLPSGQKVWVRIRAVNARGKSNWSDPACKRGALRHLQPFSMQMLLSLALMVDGSDSTTIECELTTFVQLNTYPPPSL